MSFGSRKQDRLIKEALEWKLMIAAFYSLYMCKEQREQLPFISLSVWRRALQVFISYVLVSERRLRTDSHVECLLTIRRMLMRLISLNKTVHPFPPPHFTGSRQIPGGGWDHLARVLQRHRRHQGFGPLVEKSHLQGDLQTGQRRPGRIQDILLFVGRRGSPQQPVTYHLILSCSAL